MPPGPRRERRAAGIDAAAGMIAKIAPGGIANIRPTPGSQRKDPAAVALGRKGGKARAKALSAKRRKEIARKAAISRWK